MLDFCTYFDRNYVVRGLTLFRSLVDVHPNFRLWALCFDDQSLSILKRVGDPKLIPISQAELEAADPALLAAKADRTKVEYYFTCSPTLPLYILCKNAGLDEITYLDADLYFYSDPQALFDEMGKASILMIPHRHPSDAAETYGQYGHFNVAYMTWRNDENGQACLRWWRERCIEWCYNRVEDGKYADQGYLDEWPKLFKGVHILKHIGANVAPWNWRNYDFEEKDGKVWMRTRNNPPTVPLVFYHFHSLVHLLPWIYEPFANSHAYGVMPEHIRNLIYPGYVAELHKTAAWLRKSGAAPDIKGVSLTRGVHSRREIARRFKLGWLSIDPAGLFDYTV